MSNLKNILGKQNFIKLSFPIIFESHLRLLDYHQIIFIMKTTWLIWRFDMNMTPKNKPYPGRKGNKKEQKSYQTHIICEIANPSSSSSWIHD